MDFSGISLPMVASLAVVGLINGTLYAMLSMGIAIVFGILRIVNFANGAQYMLGAFGTWMALKYLGVPYWAALLCLPLAVGAVSMLIERLLLRQLYDLHHLYGFLATFGVALLIEGVLQQLYGTSGRPYEVPQSLQGALNLGFMYLPTYRGWVLVLGILSCFITWFAIEKTKLGSYLRASAQNAKLVEAFGINVPILVMGTYGFGAALAALGGVLAAPLFPVAPLMGGNMVIVVFAVVVIGGMGSIPGAAVAGLTLGLIEGLTNLVYPQAANTVIFLVMAAVLLIRPNGLFSRSGPLARSGENASEDLGFNQIQSSGVKQVMIVIGAIAFLALLVLPFNIYPVFITHALCLALFACSFNMLLGYSGMLSFGHAAYFGVASYVTGLLLRNTGLTPEVTIIAGVLAAGLTGLIFGLLVIRLHGIYFAMATLALAQLVYFFFMQWKPSGGEEGLQNIPRGKLFGIIDLTSEISVYFLVLITFIGAMGLMYRILHSPFGQEIRAIRENEARATSLGIDVERCKLLIFVLSAVFAGLAGTLKTLAMQFVTLSDVHWSLSGAAIIMALIGGAATFIGPAVGAFVLVSADTWLSGIGISLHLIHGVILLACIVFFRAGITGGFEKFIAGWLARKHRSK
ncbi:ABC transporter permease [Ferrovibrio sp.]|uniref:ABC transporter permease n=1 Tax=Ferrovibrio sp. TaxID=1917215 RepID=UPI003D0DDE35